jgi:membrane protease YdiL (CAAX protease family)
MAGSASSGLVFGVVTLAGRWSIWPAALAHGINNTIGILELSRG